MEGNVDEYGLCEEMAEFTVTDRELPLGFKTSRQLLTDHAMDLMLAYKILGHDRSLAHTHYSLSTHSSTEGDGQKGKFYIRE